MRKEKGRKATEMLRLEALEERIAPAGNVVVVVSGGNMTITGDAEGNDIVIEEVGLDQFKISSGSNPTTINGAAELVVDGVTGGAKIAMGDGLDEVNIEDASIAKNLLIDLGKGDGRAALGKGALVGGQLTISGKDGHQIVDVGGEVEGKTSIKLGGNDGAEIGLYADFGADVKIQLGGGDEQMDVVEALIDGNLQIIAGKGEFRVDVNDSDIYGGLFVQNAQDYSRVTLLETSVEAVKFVVGSGSTRTELFDSTVFGAVDVKGGIGDDVFVANGSTIGGPIKIQNGIGESTVNFASCYVGAGFPGAHAHDVFVNNARGTCAFDVQGGDFYANKLALNYGKGYVTAQVRNAEILKDFSLKNSEGEVWLGLFDTEVAGKTAISTGSSDDTIYFNGVYAKGAVAIATGKGNDLVSLETDFTPGNTSMFDGKVKISTGDGNDEVYIGQTGIVGNSATFNAAVTLDGGKGDDYLNYLTNGNTFAIEPVPAKFETKV